MATPAGVLRRTNELPGTRARLSNLGTSAYKVRVILNLIRGKEVQEALDILRFCERAPAIPVAKLLNSAIANAQNNDELDRDELFVASCFADEGSTAKRWRPRARGRAGRIRKRSCNVTIIVARLPEDRLERVRAKLTEQQGTRRGRVAGSRAARIAGSRRRKAEESEAASTETPDVSGAVTQELSTGATEATEVAAAQSIAEHAPAESGTSLTAGVTESEPAEPGGDTEAESPNPAAESIAEHAPEASETTPASEKTEKRSDADDTKEEG